MNRDILSKVSSVEWSPTATQLLKKVHLEASEVEEVFLNLPTVRLLNITFSDSHERYLVEGATDLGKELQIVMYILHQKVVITHIKVK